MIDFPNNPSTNDTFTSGDKTWKYNGTSWVVVGVQARAVSWSDILNKPDLSTVLQGDVSWSDIINKPDLATAAQGAKADLAVQKNPSDAFPVNAIRCITQAEYNAIGESVNPNTIYIIVA